MSATPTPTPQTPRYQQVRQKITTEAAPLLDQLGPELVEQLETIARWPGTRGPDGKRLRESESEKLIAGIGQAEEGAANKKYQQDVNVIAEKIENANLQTHEEEAKLRKTLEKDAAQAWVEVVDPIRVKRKLAGQVYGMFRRACRGELTRFGKLYLIGETGAEISAEEAGKVLGEIPDTRHISVEEILAKRDQ